MTAACSLSPGELAAQLDRYRVLGHHAAVVDYVPGRVVVRFASEPPRALIERTLELERGCCPLFEVDYQPAAQRLAISVDQPEPRHSLETIARALGESRAGELRPASTEEHMQTVPGAASCCRASAREACCEPQDKPECCGQSLAGARTAEAPSRCGCDAQ